ncbi:hypothetical protein I4U23_016662 [Adineta vaga]|nr:hypothetical protein I4U23_016662 [Adineta vaga]
MVNTPITMDRVEYFLSDLPNLTYLELDLKGNIDLINSHRWEILIHIGFLPNNGILFMIIIIFSQFPYFTSTCEHILKTESEYSILYYLHNLEELSLMCSINGKLTEDFIKYAKNNRTKQIRMLEIESSTKYLRMSILYL